MSAAIILYHRICSRRERRRLATIKCKSPPDLSGDDRTASRSWCFTIAPSNNSRRVRPIMKTWKARLSRRYGAYIPDALTVICALHADVIITRSAVHEKRILMILLFFFLFAATLEHSPSIFNLHFGVQWYAIYGWD